MDPIINLEEAPGKTVGRRRPPADPLDRVNSRASHASKWHEAFRNAGIPKGVYRFTSHEEADEWLWRMITRKTES